MLVDNWVGFHLEVLKIVLLQSFLYMFWRTFLLGGICLGIELLVCSALANGAKSFPEWLCQFILSPAQHTGV